MKVIMVAVSSINGKITKGKDPNIYSWTSKEDSNFFFSLIKKHNLIVMGSKTYEAARRIIKHEKNIEAHEIEIEERIRDINKMSSHDFSYGFVIGVMVSIVIVFLYYITKNVGL